MIDSGDTAWILMSSALVLLMTPGLAFFYGGLVRSKNAAATIMQSFVMIGVVGVVWVLWGYSFAFSGDLGGFIGDGQFFGLRNVTGEAGPYSDTIPGLVFMAFQMMFAIITPALITGAFVERVKFSSLLIFTVAWVTLVYAPMAHWVWGGGWIGSELGAIDFAGGTVVHINAAMAAVAAALVIGKRRGIQRATVPHDISKVVLGTGLLWFGWFGFNAGSQLAADGGAANAFVQTNTAAAMGALVWMGLSWWKTGKPSVVGTATGAVAGLVAITPAAGFVGLWPDLDGYGNIFPALIIGGGASLLGFYAVRLLHNVRELDDTLDVFAVHGVGGLWGSLATGIFAVSAYTPAGQEGLIEGSFDLLWRQIAAMLAAAAFSFVMTAAIWLTIKQFMSVRVDEDDELAGLDRSEHEESAYQFDEPGFYSGGVSTMVSGAISEAATDPATITAEGKE
ncbi:MAG TPA: ammonium transporter [Dehalococcoidia bacterium]|nr:ammonium transporter [Dehalococcoidia bacterium]